jgi:hypothetical protein
VKSFEIQYQGHICDSWFTYQIPVPKSIEIGLKTCGSKAKLKTEYIKLAKELIQSDNTFMRFRVLEVNKEVIENFTRENYEN